MNISAVVAGVVAAGWRGALTGLVATFFVRVFVKTERGIRLRPSKSAVGLLQWACWSANLAATVTGCWVGGWRNGWKYSLLGWLAVGIVFGPPLLYLIGRKTARSTARRLSARLECGDEAALEELLDAVQGEPPLAAIMARRGASREDVRAAYRSFESNGGRTWIKGRLACAAALADPNLLDVLLAHEPDAQKTTAEILAYFNGRPIVIPGETFDEDPEEAIRVQAAKEPVPWAGFTKTLRSARLMGKLRQLFDEGKYQQVVDAVDRADYHGEGLSLDATAPLNMRAGALLRLGRYDEAIACAEIVETLAHRARADDDGGAAVTLQLFQEAIAISILAAARTAMGDRREAANRFSDAIAILDRVCDSFRLNDSQATAAEEARCRCLMSLGMSAIRRAVHDGVQAAALAAERNDDLVTVHRAAHACDAVGLRSAAPLSRALALGWGARGWLGARGRLGPASALAIRNSSDVARTADPLPQAAGPAGRSGIRREPSERNYARRLQCVDDKRVSIDPLRHAPRSASRRLRSRAQRAGMDRPRRRGEFPR